MGNNELESYVEEIDIRKEFIKNNENSVLTLEASSEILYYSHMIKCVLKDNIIH